MTVRRGAVPVRHVRLRHDRHVLHQLLDWLAHFLIQASSVLGPDHLPVRVCVPVGPCTGFESEAPCQHAVGRLKRDDADGVRVRPGPAPALELEAPRHASAPRPSRPRRAKRQREQQPAAQIPLNGRHGASRKPTPNSTPEEPNHEGMSSKRFVFVVRKDPEFTCSSRGFHAALPDPSAVRSSRRARRST